MKILEILTSRRKTGNFGERAAARYLRHRGYKVLERGYVAAGHEIDLIAENRDVLAFVEVKTRSLEAKGEREVRPASAVTPKKQRSIISAAKCYIAYKRPEKPVRLDVIEVYVTNKRGRMKVVEIKHLAGAFNRNSAYIGVKKGN